MQGKHVMDAAPGEKLGLSPWVKEGPVIDLFLWPTTSLKERELPFGKLLCGSMFDVSDVYRSEAA